MSNFYQISRILASTGIIVSASWATTYWLEQRLTQLITESTVEALQNPEIQDEVYTLLQKLLVRLLNDQTSREQAVEFLNKVMGMETFQKSLTNLLLEVLNRADAQEQGFSLAKKISYLILTDPQLKLKLYSTTKNTLTMLSEDDSFLRNYQFKQKIQLTSIPQFTHTPIRQINMQNTLKNAEEFIQACKITAHFNNLSLPEIKLKQIDEMQTPDVPKFKLKSVQSIQDEIISNYYQNQMEYLTAVPQSIEDQFYVDNVDGSEVKNAIEFDEKKYITF